MTSLLLMKGMKHIALLGGSMLYTVNQSRLEGFRQAYEKMGQVIDEGLLFLELETDDLRMWAVQQAVERGADCILCMDERLAQLSLNVLKQLNCVCRRISDWHRCMTARIWPMPCRPSQRYNLMPTFWASRLPNSCCAHCRGRRWRPE